MSSFQTNTTQLALSDIKDKLLEWAIDPATWADPGLDEVTRASLLEKRAAHVALGGPRAITDEDRLVAKVVLCTEVQPLLYTALLLKAATEYSHSAKIPNMDLLNRLMPAELDSALKEDCEYLSSLRKVLSEGKFYNELKSQKVRAHRAETWRKAKTVDFSDSDTAEKLLTELDAVSAILSKICAAEPTTRSSMTLLKELSRHTYTTEELNKSELAKQCSEPGLVVKSLEDFDGEQLKKVKDALKTLAPLFQGLCPSTTKTDDAAKVKIEAPAEIEATTHRATTVESDSTMDDRDATHAPSPEPVPYRSPRRGRDPNRNDLGRTGN